MQISVTFYVTIMIASCLVLTGYTTGQSFVEPPSATTGLVGAPTPLSCKVAFGHIHNMMWEHNGLYIYAFMHGYEEYPYGKSKYEFTRNGSIFHIEIKNLTLNDSGIITCHVSEYTAEAHLIVLDNPVLHIDPQDLEEGDSTTISCDASFGGPKKESISTDHFPKLEMYLEGELLPAAAIDDDKNSYHLHKVYNLNVSANMDEGRITCTIKTSRPAFNATKFSKLKLMYSVRNLTYTPQLKQYEVGSNLTCTAQGNPPPVIEWENAAGKKFQGKQLQITESMVGPNKWRCTALNIIRGIKHEESMIAEFAVGKDFDYESTSTDPVDDVSENENNSSRYWIIGLILSIVVLAVGIGVLIFVMKRKQRRSATTTDSELRIITNGMMMKETAPLMPSQDEKADNELEDQQALVTPSSGDMNVQSEVLLEIVKQSTDPLKALCQLMKVEEQRQELFRNQKSLLQFIQTGAFDDNMVQSRTEILGILVSKAEYISKDYFIKWTDDFLLTLEALLEHGADPTWIHEVKTYTKTAQYAFVGAIQNILLEKSDLYGTIEKVIPLFLAKECNMQKQCYSTVLHALVNTDWKDLNANAKTVPLDFFTYYNNVIAEVIKCNPSIVDKQDENGATPLQLYIQDLKMQEKMLNPVIKVVAKLKSEININMTDSDDKTVLHYLTRAFPMFTTNITQAGQDTFLRMVKEITSDNNSNIQDCKKQTVLHILAKKYRHEVPKDSKNILCRLVKLWANKSNVDVKDLDGKTFLHIFAKKYSDQVTETASKDYLEIIRHVAALSDRNIQDKEGFTVLHVIAQTYDNSNQCKDLFNALIAGADINIPNKNGDTLMHIFAKRYATGQNSEAKTLLLLMIDLIKQCKTLAQNHKGSTMLHIMMENYLATHDQSVIVNLVKICVNKDVTIATIQDDQMCTALHILARRFPNQVSTENSKSFLEMIKVLATDKTRDITDKRGYTALQVVANKCRKDMTECCREIFPELVKILISPYNINFQNENGSTVLHAIANRVFYDPSLGKNILPILPDLTSQNVNTLNTYSTTPYSWILNGKEIYKDNKEIQEIFYRIEEVFRTKGALTIIANLNCLI